MPEIPNFAVEDDRTDNAEGEKRVVPPPPAAETNSMYAPIDPTIT